MGLNGAFSVAWFHVPNCGENTNISISFLTGEYFKKQLRPVTYSKFPSMFTMVTLEDHFAKVSSATSRLQPSVFHSIHKRLKFHERKGIHLGHNFHND